MLAANLAADLDAWLRLLTPYDINDLADAEPDTMRLRLYHLPARLADQARQAWGHYGRTTEPFNDCTPLTNRGLTKYYLRDKALF
jgi:hypothetical protein